MIWSIEIPGIPVAQARPRATRVGSGIRLYEPRKVAEYKAYMKTLVAVNKPAQLFDGPCVVCAAVHVLKPASWPKRRKHAATKPDADNFAKILMDCLEGLVYTNDSRVVALHITKHLSAYPCVKIQVEEIEE